VKTERHHTTAKPTPGTDPVDVTVDVTVDFAAVGRVLADAAVLVRTRGELGEQPARDRRPRIRAAIARAGDLAGLTGAADRPVRDWACVLAAMQINAALGRGRRRDHLDVAASALTLDGFGLDVGTMGAVNSAADLLAQAAVTAGLIADAQPVPVHGHGPVRAYHLGVIRAADVETDDIVTVDATFLDEKPGDTPRNLRVRDIATHDDATRTVVLDLPVRPRHLHTNADWLATVWRPVPHLHHPWQQH
jgi:hypothetical protein